MAYFQPDEETLDPSALRALQSRKLAAMLSVIAEGNRFYARKLEACGFGASPASCSLSDLPFTTRAELEQDQLDHPPYGTNLSFAVAAYSRFHQTSGSSGTPLRWLDTLESWSWWKDCWGVIYRAAGVIDADRFFFPFSFGPFIGFWGAFESACALGNLSVPGGGMTTAARVQALFDHRVTIVCCTPTYALRMGEVADELGVDLVGSSVRGLIVAGEPGGNIPSTRSKIEKTWGARVFDHAGMTELGPWGFECAEAPGGMHLMEHEFVGEVVDPDTGERVAEGEPGELVLTNLGRMGSPLLRYRTGDRVRMTRGRCACGRWFARVAGGILGRADDMLVVRGNNVFPSAIEEILRSFDEVAEFQLEVDGRDALAELVIRVDLRPGAVDGWEAGLAHALQDRLHFRPRVEVVPSGSLPRFEMKARRVVRRGDG